MTARLSQSVQRLHRAERFLLPLVQVRFPQVSIREKKSFLRGLLSMLRTALNTRQMHILSLMHPGRLLFPLLHRDETNTPAIKDHILCRQPGFRVFIRLLITEAVLMEAVFINTALSFRHHLFQQVLIVIWVICLTRAQEEADFGKQTIMQRVPEDEVLSSLILADTHIIIKFPI